MEALWTGDLSDDLRRVFGTDLSLQKPVSWVNTPALIGTALAGVGF